MGNYRFAETPGNQKGLPAGWRGIGCLLMILLPIASYLAAIELLKIDTIRTFFYRVNPALFGPPSLHPILWKLKTITPFLNLVYSWNNLEVNLIFGLVILIALSGIVSVIYAFMFRAVRPSPYGPLDAPPSKHKPKKYVR